MRMSLYWIVEHLYKIEYLPFGFLPSRVYLSFGDPLFKGRKLAITCALTLANSKRTAKLLGGTKV
jgi:hypothetical protein